MQYSENDTKFCRITNQFIDFLPFNGITRSFSAVSSDWLKNFRNELNIGVDFATVFTKTVDEKWFFWCHHLLLHYNFDYGIRNAVEVPFLMFILFYTKCWTYYPSLAQVTTAILYSLRIYLCSDVNELLMKWVCDGFCYWCYTNE